MTSKPDLRIGSGETLGPHGPHSVFERMVAIIEELPAIGKTQRNQEQNFMFRGYDQVMNALNPLLSKHGVFIVPDVIERVTSERQTSRGKTMYEVNLHVEFTFYGLAGDSFTASGWGEGTDMGDKATNKAMTGAFKYVLFQTFAIATAEDVDADAIAMEETTRGGPQEREEGVQLKSQRPEHALIAGAIEVASEEDALSLRTAQRDLAPEENWPAIENQLAAAVFNGATLEQLTRAQTGQWWRRLANAVAKAYEKGDFPPPSREEIQAAYAWAFEGTVLELGTLTTPFEGTAQTDEPEALPEDEKP